MASLTGFTLPEIKDSNLNDEKERRKILEYLYQLTEQLRFTLSNLDEENFSDSVSDNIQGAYTAASSASKEVKDMSGNVSRIKQFADTLTLAVENGDTSSSIALMANGVQIASEEIILRGAVTFTDLATAGRTTINGSNIKTGTINANNVAVTNLNANNIKSGTISGIQVSGIYGTFDELEALGGLIHFGRNYIEINGVEVGYVPGYSEVCIIGPGYEQGNIGSGSIPWSQCVAAHLYSSDGGVSTYSMRKLKTDIKPFSLPEGAFDNLQPVYFVMKKDKKHRRQIGFIADDVQKICPELVVEFQDESMEEAILTLDYAKITALLVDEVKKLRARMQNLEEKTA